MRPMSEPEAPAELSELVTELAEAFRRYRPQGSPQWNFADAFRRLEAVVAEGAGAGHREGEANPDAVAGGITPGPRARLRELAEDRLWSRLRTRVGAGEDLTRAVEWDSARLAEGLDATLEAFRFLAARLEHLERADVIRRSPIDGCEWLLEPVDLDWWIGPLGEWIAGMAPPGAVVVGDCGEGQLAAELQGHGLSVRAAEPRGAVAWRAAEQGIPVRIGSVRGLLDVTGPATLGGVVLCDVVDRLAVEDLIALVQAATRAARPGAPLVVLGRHPDHTSPDPVAADLLPGRPLHPETWERLLDRAGYRAVERCADPADNGTDEVFCVRGLRGR